MRQSRKCIVVVLCCVTAQAPLLCAAGPASGPTSKPTTAPASKPTSRPALLPAPRPISSQRIIENAIEALHKEYAAAQKDPGKSPLRERCDYFDEHPAPDLKVEPLLTALERNLPGDARESSYIRWQLLSGLNPGELHDPRLYSLAVEVYRKAPPPAPRFGITPEDQAQLNALAASARREDDVTINSQVEEAVKKGIEANRYPIAYRNEFYRRLPKMPETFLAGIVDADQRLKRAAGAREWMPTIINDIYAWMGSDASDAQGCATLADNVAQLRFRAAWPYYDKVVLGKQNKLTWEKKSDSANPDNRLPALQQALLEEAKKPRPPTHATPPKPTASTKPKPATQPMSATSREAL